MTLYRTHLHFLTAVLLFSVIGLSAQSSYRFQHSTLPCLNKKFTVVAHIFIDSLGNYGLTEQQINDAFSATNVWFEPIGVSFEVCEFRYHDNWSHDILDDGEEADQMVKKYFADYRINFYFVTEPNDQASPCGFATLNGIQNPFDGRVVIKKEDCVSDGVFGHELGHFFGLLHTFEGNGLELVNGDNCETEGDMICDTPADPYIPNDPISDYLDEDNCIYISMRTDANGEFYNPDIGNIMSYYPCGNCGFTHGQLSKMAENYLNSNPKFW